MNLKLSVVNYQLSIFLLLFFTLPLKAQVTIGAQKAPHSYSVLELKSAKGLRLPMLSNSERDALNLTSDSTEASGLVIFNSDMDCIEFWADGMWTDLCSGGALPVDKIMNPVVLANLPFGNGAISGRTLFDIDATDGGTSSCGSLASRTAYKADFSANSTYDYVYTTASTQTVQNVRYVIQDPEGVLLTSQAQPLSGTLVPDILGPGESAPALTLKFKPDLNLQSSQPSIVGRDRSAAAKVIINIVYNNGSLDAKVATTLSIQDCSCGNSVKTVGGGWLTFMCYNLGAADTLQSISPYLQAYYTKPADEYGDLYQWGRAADGHQLRTSESYLTNVAVTESSPVSGSNLDDNGQVASTSAAFKKFIKNNDLTTTYGDWRTPQADTLWYNNGKKTVNDPCPTGWRVPTGAELQSIMNGNDDQVNISGSYNSVSGNKWQWVSSSVPGYLVTPSGSSSPTLFLPAAGYRGYASSSLTSVGSSGYYWSSSVNDTNVYCLNFNSGIVLPAYNYNRAYGFSVRCVIE